MRADGLKVVNIGSEDVHGGNPKLILGLLWTIIYNYQVTKGFKLGEQSPKDALLEWVNSKIGDPKVSNFKKDWYDGRALGRLVNAIGSELYPGEPVLLPEEEGWEDAVRLARDAIEAAEKSLCVSKVVSPEDLASGDCDEHSIMTYISLFREAHVPKVEAELKDLTLEQAAPVTEPEPEPEPEPSPSTTKVPPWERPPDWREYAGEDLGGRCKIRVFFSTTTHDLIIRKNTEALQKLLEAFKVHERPDFEPWIPVDMDMDREFRNKLFERAGTRKTPLLFVDDEFMGTYEELMELNEVGQLRKIFDY